jgi:hypothetical protein
MNETTIRELTCPISLGIMRDPVSLRPCGHNFDSDSLWTFITHFHETRQHITSYSCPSCRQSFTIDDITPNRTLKAIIDSYTRNEPIIDNDDRLISEDDDENNSISAAEALRLLKRYDIENERNRLQALILVLVSAIYLLFLYFVCDIMFYPLILIVKNLSLIGLRIVLLYPAKLIFLVLYGIGETIYTIITCLCVLPIMLTALVFPVISLLLLLKSVSQLFSKKGVIVSKLDQLITSDIFSRPILETCTELINEVMQWPLWDQMIVYLSIVQEELEYIIQRLKSHIPPALKRIITPQQLIIGLMAVIVLSLFVYCVTPVATTDINQKHVESVAVVHKKTPSNEFMVLPAGSSSQVPSIQPKSKQQIRPAHTGYIDILLLLSVGGIVTFAFIFPHFL